MATKLHVYNAFPIRQGQMDVEGNPRVCNIVYKKTIKHVLHESLEFT